MTRRPAMAAVASALCLFLVTLAAFPNYCDFCSYRFASRALRAYAGSAAAAGACHGEHRSCCPPARSSRPAGGEDRRDDGAGSGPGAPNSFCLTGTLLASIATPMDIPLLVRPPLAPARVPGPDAAFVPGDAAAVPHQPRAPPA